MASIGLRISLYAAILTATFAVGVVTGIDHQKGAQALQEKTQREQWEDQRNVLQKAITDQAREWVQYTTQSKQSADRVIADLNSRNVRLSVRVSDLAVAQCRSGAIPNGRAELHEETASALVRITRDADEQVKALQGTVKALQGGAP